MYRVIERFKDLQNRNHIYEVGDEFPHDGKRISAKRIAELSSSDNRIGKPLIEEIVETPVVVDVEETEDTVE